MTCVGSHNPHGCSAIRSYGGADVAANNISNYGLNGGTNNDPNGGANDGSNGGGNDRLSGDLAVGGNSGAVDGASVCEGTTHAREGLSSFQ